MNIIETKDLCKTYVVNKKQNHVLRNINLKIKKGEFVTVMGPSGSGKSTLLYNVSGMDKITSGSVFFNNKEINVFSENEMSVFRLNKMGFIFQNSHLLKNLDILDNILVSGYKSKISTRAEVKKRALDLMTMTGIRELSDNDITQVSGGQLQRAAICRSLINEPDIIFGDEPTGALNSSSAKQIIDILTDINEAGKTIMLVTHDAKVAAQTERVIFLNDGIIEGELNLGKSDKNEVHLKERERKLTNWLFDMGW
ncbi:MAG: ABC transporter ATP-binding protein [Spirochaetaceae bacterium]